MVRLGVGIYGISGVDQDKLKPVAYFRCPIVQIKTLTDSDGPVGYSRKGILPSGTHKIATIPVGYADGINRHFGCGSASFELHGKMVPTVGNICMCRETIFWTYFIFSFKGIFRRLNISGTILPPIMSWP
jgi:Alanine racemase